MATGNERSRVLEAFRAVGVIALPLKCPVLRRGVDNFVTTSVKNGFQVCVGGCERVFLPPRGAQRTAAERR